MWRSKGYELVHLIPAVVPVLMKAVHGEALRSTHILNTAKLRGTLYSASDVVLSSTPSSELNVVHLLNTSLKKSGT